MRSSKALREGRSGRASAFLLEAGSISAGLFGGEGATGIAGVVRALWLDQYDVCFLVGFWGSVRHARNDEQLAL